MFSLPILGKFDLHLSLLNMYGIVNDAIRGLIVSDFGEARWEEIRRDSGNEDDFFLSHVPYPDQVTYDLAISASRVLSLPLETVLNSFGEYWILETGRKKYPHLLQTEGMSIREFLIRLPDFHARIKLLFSDLQPPEFKITHLESHQLHLHYYSERPGLQDFVRGLISGLGKLFETPVEISLLTSRANGEDHETFLVKWQ